jgi:hypothetical protein
MSQIKTLSVKVSLRHKSHLFFYQLSYLKSDSSKTEKQLYQSKIFCVQCI